MKITADKEGIETIKSLCDVALKAGGLANLDAIQTVLQSIVEKETEIVPRKN